MKYRIDDPDPNMFHVIQAEDSELEKKLFLTSFLELALEAFQKAEATFEGMELVPDHHGQRVWHAWGYRP
jgi:hypothetical protein